MDYINDGSLLKTQLLLSLGMTRDSLFSCSISKYNGNYVLHGYINFSMGHNKDYYTSNVNYLHCEISDEDIIVTYRMNANMVGLCNLY
jgi:hypothetical protein